MRQGSRGREEMLGFFWTKSNVCDFVLVTATAVELYARVTQVRSYPVPGLGGCVRPERTARRRHNSAVGESE